MNKLWLSRLKEPKVKPLPEERGVSLVSKVGYINNQRRIEAMLREGMQLRQFRMNLENGEEKAISEELMKNIDRIDQSSNVKYLDKIGSIEAMQRQMNDLELKYEKAQESLKAARQKASEEASNKVAEEEKRLDERIARMLDSRDRD